MNDLGPNQFDVPNPERRPGSRFGNNDSGDLSPEHLRFWLLSLLMTRYGREPGF